MDKSDIASLLSLIIPASVAILTTFTLALFPDLAKAKRRTKVVAIAVPAVLVLGLWQLQRHIEKTPHGSVAFRQSQELEFGYTPKSQQLAIKIDGVLLTRDPEVWVSDISATLTSGTRGLSSEVFPFAFSDFACSTDSKDLKPPFAVRVGVSLPLSCNLISNLSKAKVQALLGSGEHQLDVRLRTDSGNLTAINYCFPLTDEVAKELVSTPVNSAHRFLYPDCER